MFTDSNIAKSITVRVDKMKHVVNCGIAPDFKSILTDSVKKAKEFVALFDESLNGQTQNSEMDILIRHFDDTESIIKVHYLTSHSAHTDLYQEFSSALKNLMATNCFRFLWMDLTSSQISE